jgi:hypothetical protein
MCAAGMFLAPLTPFPAHRIWLRFPLFLVAVAACLVATWGMLITDLIPSNKYLERDGQLATTGLLAFIVGFFWTSKGWNLIQRGISATPSGDARSSGGLTGTPWGQYVSLFLGVLVLILWLGLLAWSASSDWAYAPEKISTPRDNLFSQFGSAFNVMALRLLEKDPRSRIECGPQTPAAPYADFHNCRDGVCCYTVARDHLWHTERQ